MMRIDGYDWTAIASDLDRQGWAVLPTLLTIDESDAVAGLYGNSPT